MFGLKERILMFKHILVPLDGSHLAEAALPAAVYLSQILDASVVLLHIIEEDAPKEVHRDRHLTNPAEAEIYLQDVAQRFKVQVETHVHRAPVADVARSIVEHVTNEFQPELIILTSHGNTGMRELVFGSIAQKVAATSGIPVLLIRPREAPAPFQLEHILVPLDNESVHDKTLPFAEALATIFKSELNLLCVIPTRATDSGEHAAAGTMLPMTAAAYLDIAEEIAQEHFQAHLDEFQKNGLSATAEIARGDPAPVIVKTAERFQTDLILFGTHGRAGLEAFWNRSVTAAVARRTHVPLLLIPIPD